MSVHSDSDDLGIAAMAGGDPPPHVADCASCTADWQSLKDLAERLRGLARPPHRLQEIAGAYFARRRALDSLIASMAEDPALRMRAEKSPDAVLRDAGLEPDPDLIEALRDVGRGSSGAGARLAASLWF